VDITIENQRATAETAKQAAKAKAPPPEPKEETAQAWYTNPMVKAGAKMGIGGAVGGVLNIAIPQLPTSMIGTAVATAALTGAGVAAPKVYRVISLTPEALASILPRSRTALFDTLLDAVEGGSKISRNVLASHLAKLKPYISKDRVLTAEELKKLQEETERRVRGAEE
jgi:hypothetical protein